MVGETYEESESGHQAAQALFCARSFWLVHAAGSQGLKIGDMEVYGRQQ